jgi:protein-L-isoaspartate O-methyltransferase
MVVAETGGVRQYVAFLERSLVGLNASDGRLLWTYDKVSNHITNSNTPIVIGDQILAGSGYVGSLALLKLTVEENQVRVQEETIQQIGQGAFQDCSFVIGEHLHVGSHTGVSCFNWKTGQQVWTARSKRPSFTYADDRLYLRDIEGNVTLAEVSSQEYLPQGSFQIPDAVSAIGATSPVIAGGRLYLRDDNKLLCYDIRKTALDQPPREPQRISLPVPAAKPNSAHRRTLHSVFVPTPQDVVEQMLKLAGVKKTDLVYDLGSGDGRIVVTAAKTYGCRAIGYELDKELVEQSRAKAEMAGVKSLVTIESKDLFTADLREADVIAVYLLPQQLEKLLPQLESLKAGTRIVSHQFEIPGHKADRTIALESREDGAIHTIFLWTSPLKKN